jgi:hypothetical protein
MLCPQRSRKEPARNVQRKYGISQVHFLNVGQGYNRHTQEKEGRCETHWRGRLEQIDLPFLVYAKK